MSAIPCSSVSVKTMADGTLRISFDIEPNHALDAFKLFHSPGTPAAIAALRVGYQKVTEVINKTDNIDKPANNSVVNDSLTTEQKGGALAKLAGMWCNDPEFWKWLETDPDNACHSATGAAACLYDICGIDSRAELDHNADAAEKFHRLIRGPYQKYLIARGIVS